MGGSGSGRWRGYPVRFTVEHCATLTADRMARQGILRPLRHTTGHWGWERVASREDGPTLEFELDTTDMADPWIHLWYRPSPGGRVIDYRVSLTTISPPCGLRWFFRCPCMANGIPCGRRVGMLHRHPTAEYFGCRSCQRLTYTSCQDSHRPGLFRMLFPELHPRVARRVLIRGWP